MINFLSYMIFSGLEYLALLLLMFSVFSVRLNYYKREIIIVSTSATLISYLLIIFNIYKYAPIPLILAIVLSFVFRHLFSVRYTYALIVSLGGLLLYGLLQGAIVKLSVIYGILSPDAINNPFAIKSYILQAACSLLVSTISIYTILTRGGFGFTFRKKTNRLFVISLCCLFALSLLTYSAFTFTETTGILTISVVALIVSGVSVLVLSRKQDNIEYSL